MLIGPILKDFKYVYANYFFMGDIKKATRKLNHHDEKPSKINNNVITCLISSSCTLIFIDFFLIYVIKLIDETLLEKIPPIMPFLRIGLAFAYGLFAAGLCVKTFV